MDIQCLNHRGVQVCHVGNPFAILLKADHHLLMPVSWLGIEDMAIIPWSWDQRKVLRPGQDCVESLDHVLFILEGYRCIEITLPLNVCTP